MTLHVTIPDDLSPQQVWALYNILDDLQQYLWECYEQPLVNFLYFDSLERFYGPDEVDDYDDDLDDPIPF